MKSKSQSVKALAVAGCLTSWMASGVFAQSEGSSGVGSSASASADGDGAVAGPGLGLGASASGGADGGRTSSGVESVQSPSLGKALEWLLISPQKTKP